MQTLDRPSCLGTKPSRRLHARSSPGSHQAHGFEVTKMNDQELAHEIAKNVAHDTQFWIAVVGLLGVFVGALSTAGVKLLENWLQSRKQKWLDDARKKLLCQMLEARDWRKLSTLSRVIGA